MFKGGSDKEVNNGIFINVKHQIKAVEATINLFPMSMWKIGKRFLYRNGINQVSNWKPKLPNTLIYLEDFDGPVGVKSNCKKD